MNIPAPYCEVGIFHYLAISYINQILRPKIIINQIKL